MTSCNDWPREARITIEELTKRCKQLETLLGGLKCVDCPGCGLNHPFACVECGLTLSEAIKQIGEQ